MEVPPYRVRAHNAATDSENRIHDDAIARHHGFRGGLVPGVTVYAYMTYPVVAAFGRPWLERGAITARFHRPFYDGDTVTVSTTIIEPDTLELTATNDDGIVCATARASLTPAQPLPDPARFPPAPPTADPVPPTPEALGSLDVLGSLEAGFHADRGPAFLGQLDDDLQLYRRERLAHPGWLLRKANDILAANVRLGPWVHTGSTVTNFGAVTDGDRVATRARVSELFTRKGHEIVELDVLLLVDRDRPVGHIRHSAIYRLAERSSST